MTTNEQLDQTDDARSHSGDMTLVLTRRAFRSLHGELARLEVRLSETLDQLASTQRDIGGDDFPDVAVYYDAVVSREYLEQRISHLHYVLREAQIREDDTDLTRITHGARVIVWDFAARDEMIFDVVSSMEAMREHQTADEVMAVSSGSPVGRALYGRVVGDIVDVDTPLGRLRYCVRAIMAIPD